MKTKNLQNNNSHSDVEARVILEFAKKLKEEHRKKSLLFENKEYVMDLAKAERLRGYLAGIEWAIHQTYPDDSKLSK